MVVTKMQETAEATKDAGPISGLNVTHWGYEVFDNRTVDFKRKNRGKELIGNHL